MDANKRYQAWLEDQQVDETTKQELLELEGQDNEIYERFYKQLQFGTGGLRGKLGAGPNRMNLYTVRLATQALANVLNANGQGDNGVALACDSRRLSQEFVQAAAAVLVENRIPVYVFREITPTPLLSFAVRQCQAGAGIMVTASHNPPEYNGYKVYQSDGGQILSDIAQQISEVMEELALADVTYSENPVEHPLWTWVDEDLYTEYYQQLKALCPGREMQDLSLRVLYTPLHGTGGKFVPRALKEAGFTQVDCVLEQLSPDENFPTVKLPNPEEADAFRLAFSQAGNGNYDVIMATDPDGDRVGVALLKDQGYALLNGNQIGILLTDYLLQTVPVDQRANCVVITTIVTTEMIKPIVRKFGVELIQTLTGFKYIADQMGILEQKNKRFLFGFEESYGYLAGNFVRDKDAVMASLLVTQMAAYYKSKGISLLQRLDQLMEEHGFYFERLRSYAFHSSVEAEKANRFIEDLRQQSFTTIAGLPIRIFRDYLQGIESDLIDNTQTPILLPREDVLQWETTAGDRITLRPSGTEPKMKLYVGAVSKNQTETEVKLAKLEAAFTELVTKGLEK